MILRVYRITDKFGLVILKLTSAIGEWLFDGIGVLTDVAGGFIGIIVSVLMVLFGVIASILTLLINVIKRILQSILNVIKQTGALIGRLLSFVFGVGATTVRRASRTSSGIAQSAGQSATTSMARRAARAEIDATVTEDPLRAQNRLLSGAFVLLGVVVIGIVLWATDPSRSFGVPVASVPNENISGVFSSTLVPTTESGSAIIVASPIPTATQIPEVFQIRGAIAYVVREKGQDDIWAVNVGSRSPIRITNDLADESSPVWSPPDTGSMRLAYSSNKDGNWEIYVYDLDTEESTRMTFDLSYQDSPKWSNDGLWLVYESYQGNNLDIYAMPVDGSEAPIRITDHPSADYSPAWSPDGRQIAFVSLREGNQDIYIFNLDTLETVNLTNTPNRNENFPSWSPDSRELAFSATEIGRNVIFVQPANDPSAIAEVIGFGQMPSWSPATAAKSLVFVVDAEDGRSTYLSARPYSGDGIATEVIAVPQGATYPTWSDRALPASLLNSDGLPLAVEDDLYIEQSSSSAGDVAYKLSPLNNVVAPNPVLSDAVNDSFNALRSQVLEASGQDYLGELEDTFWVIDQLPQPGEDRRNWHKTGRAFSITRNSILGFPSVIELVREDSGVNTFWRVYLRVADEAQSGQLGKPLKQLPWDFLSRSSGDVEAYNQGGRPKTELPAGYYIDLTKLAADYGWEWTPAGNDWRANANTINYWMFRKTEGLDWYNAMLEIYADSQLGGFAATPTPASSVPTVEEDEG
jgi:TolB protein